jgi:hypothetical protein
MTVGCQLRDGAGGDEVHDAAGVHRVAAQVRRNSSHPESLFIYLFWRSSSNPESHMLRRNNPFPRTHLAIRVYACVHVRLRTAFTVLTLVTC